MKPDLRTSLERFDESRGSDRRRNASNSVGNVRKELSLLVGDSFSKADKNACPSIRRVFSELDRRGDHAELSIVSVLRYDKAVLDDRNTV